MKQLETSIQTPLFVLVNKNPKITSQYVLRPSFRPQIPDDSAPNLYWVTIMSMPRCGLPSRADAPHEPNFLPRPFFRALNALLMLSLVLSPPSPPPP